MVVTLGCRVKLRFSLVALDINVNFPAITQEKDGNFRLCDRPVFGSFIWANFRWSYSKCRLLSSSFRLPSLVMSFNFHRKTHFRSCISHKMFDFAKLFFLKKKVCPKSWVNFEEEVNFCEFVIQIKVRLSVWQSELSNTCFFNTNLYSYHKSSKRPSTLERICFGNFSVPNWYWWM